MPDRSAQRDERQLPRRPARRTGPRRQAVRADVADVTAHPRIGVADHRDRDPSPSGLRRNPGAHGRSERGVRAAGVEVRAGDVVVRVPGVRRQHEQRTVRVRVVARTTTKPTASRPSAGGDDDLVVAGRPRPGPTANVATTGQSQPIASASGAARAAPAGRRRVCTTTRSAPIRATSSRAAPRGPRPNTSTVSPATTLSGQQYTPGSVGSPVGRYAVSSWHGPRRRHPSVRQCDEAGGAEAVEVLDLDPIAVVVGDLVVRVACGG